MEKVFIDLNGEDLQGRIDKIEKLGYKKQDDRYGIKTENTGLIVGFSDGTYLTSKFSKEYYIGKGFKHFN